MILRKKLKQLLLFVKHWHEILIIKDYIIDRKMYNKENF